MLNLWINGEHVSTRGLRVLRLPPVTRPEARVEEITVPGRSGVLTTWRGDYWPISMPVDLHYAGDSPRAALDWLGTAHSVRFGNNPDWIYDCHRRGVVEAVRSIADWHAIRLSLLCNPERRALTEPILTGNPVSVTNEGTEIARPRIMMQASSSTVVLTVGEQQWTLQGVTGTVTLDGLLGIVTDSSGSAWNKLDRPDLPAILPGATVAISATGVSQLSVKMQERWV